MRKIVTAILVIFVLTLQTSYLAYAEYNDVIAEVEDLKSSAIMLGDPDGNMRLDDAVTRAEAAALIIRAYGYDVNTIDIAKSDFTDMDGHWASKEVSVAKSLGLVDGTTDTAFEPDKSVTIQEFVEMTVSLLGYKERAEVQGGYPHGYLMTANSLGLTKGITAEATDNAIRKDVAVILAKALDIPLMVQTGFGSVNEYTVLDGKNGVELKTLRIIRGDADTAENQSDSNVPHFNGEE